MHLEWNWINRPWFNKLQDINGPPPPPNPLSWEFTVYPCLSPHYLCVLLNSVLSREVPCRDWFKVCCLIWAEMELNEWFSMPKTIPLICRNFSPQVFSPNALNSKEDRYSYFKKNWCILEAKPINKKEKPLSMIHIKKKIWALDLEHLVRRLNESLALSQFVFMFPSLFLSFESGSVIILKVAVWSSEEGLFNKDTDGTLEKIEKTKSFGTLSHSEYSKRRWW